MTKKSTRVEVNSFVKGFLTETSPLNTPPDATTDEQNFELRRNGTRDRRLGLDLETATAFDGYSVFFQERDTLPQPFVWKSPGGDSSSEFLVLGTYDTVYIFDLTKDMVSNDAVFSFTPTNLVKGKQSFASVDGKLIIAYGTPTVCVLSYNPFLDTFTPTYERIKSRDLWGVDEEQDEKLRPTTLTPFHEYNLANQSWGVTRRNGSLEGSPFGNPIQIFHNYFKFYPSNVETVWTGLDFKATTPPTEAIIPSLYSESIDAFGKAAKGYFIIDVLNRGSSRYEAFTSNPLSTTNPSVFSLITPLLTFSAALLNTDVTDGGPTVVTSHAGRVFFGGFSGKVSNPIKTSPDLSSYIFFSQLVRNELDVFKCYQEGDPTSRESSEILDTDGGFIRISGLARVVGLVTLNNSLIVLGSNGVWEIKGADGGFSATDYAVRKLSNFGCVSDGSIVAEGDAVFFWSDSGILVISPDQFDNLKVTNITQTTIQTFYENISPESKENSRGVYDPQTRKVRWIYDIEIDTAVAGQTKELIFDLSLNAFSRNVFGNNTITNPRVVGLFNTPPFRSGISQEDVVIGGDPVQVLGEQVVVTSVSRESGVESVKYIVYYVEEGGVAVRRGFAEMTNQNFKDWEKIRTGGIDAKAFLFTGAVTAGDSTVHKQTPYLVTHFLRTEEGMELEGGQLVPSKQSSCLIRSMWDWADGANSNKWSPLFQAYRERRPYFPSNISDPYDTGFQTVVTRNKLRGRGRAISLYIETEPEKDCRIQGWNLSINGNAIA